MFLSFITSELCCCGIKVGESGNKTRVLSLHCMPYRLTLHLLLPPVGPIQLLSGPDSMTVQVGTNLSLTCDFHSTPNTTISWSGVPLTSAGRFKVQDTVVREEGVEFLRSVLSVTPVADYDGARIECRASNGEDVLEHSFQLTVNGEDDLLH